MPLTIFGQYALYNGVAADTDTAFDVNPNALRLDITITNAGALLTFSPDLVHFTQARLIQGGVIASLDMLVRKFMIRNAVAGANASFNILAYYDPIEIVGRQLTRIP